MAIITSLLDTDLYKFTMLHAVRKTCQRTKINVPYVQYRFKCRNKKNLLPFKKEIEKEIDSFMNLKFSQEDIDYLMSLGYFDNVFANHLSEINLKTVQVNVYEFDNELNISIEGKMDTAILFEVPLLAIVNEVYFKHQTIDKKVANKNLVTFLSEMSTNFLIFTDFGTRRRFSKKWQEKCIKDALVNGCIKGTSNVLFAKQFHIPCVGTMAHEWLQLFQALSENLRDFQKDALTHWMLTYRGKLDTALTDIIGIDAFLKDWDSFFIKNYSALRHDSGSPFEFVDKVCKRYNKCSFPDDGVTLLFSDGLTPSVCNEIRNYVNDYIGISAKFGIGTNFTNNMGIEQLQIVIKLAKVNGSSVIKISDSAGKAMNDKDNMIYKLKQTFNLKETK